MDEPRRQGQTRGLDKANTACDHCATARGLYGSIEDHLGFQHTLDVNWVALLVSVFSVSFPRARNMGVHTCLCMVPVCALDR